MTQIRKRQMTLLASMLLAAVGMFLLFEITQEAAWAQDPKAKACETVGKLTGEAGCGEAGSDEVGNKIGEIALAIVNVLSIVAGAVAVIFLVIGGIKYASSGGSPEKTKSAKSTILAALIGLAIIIATRFLLSVAVSFTEQLTGDGGDGGDGGGTITEQSDGDG